MPIGGGGTIPIDSEHIPHFTWGSPRPTDNDSLTVAIVGAGCAGLFVPMVFNELRKILKEKNLPDLPVTCEIFEACPEKRLGGRLYTYQFPQGGSHDYYDVGAMRFPDVPVMKRRVEIVLVAWTCADGKLGLSISSKMNCTCRRRKMQPKQLPLAHSSNTTTKVMTPVTSQSTSMTSNIPSLLNQARNL